jgi:hypothetical protein
MGAVRKPKFIGNTDQRILLLDKLTKAYACWFPRPASHLGCLDEQRPQDGPSY